MTNETDPESIRETKGVTGLRRCRRMLGRLAFLLSTFAVSLLLVIGGMSLLLAILLPAIPACVLLQFRPKLAISGLAGSAIAAIVLAIVASRTPRNGRDWETPVSRTPTITVEGAALTVHDLRDFEWGPDGLTERWTARTYDLADLRGVDLIVEPFNLSGLMAHTMLSFDFGETGRLLLSIEARKEQSERYGALRGGLNTFELIYVFATEEDALTLRARKGYELIAYPTNTDPLWLRAFLLSLAAEANILREHPRFYHTTRDNCTSAWIRRADSLNPDRLGTQLGALFPGLLDRLLAERGVLAIEGPIEQAREAYRIDQAVLEYAGQSDFSRLIRSGLPNGLD